VQGGTEDAPTNLWRIVVLTDEPDGRYREPFDAMARAGWLPGFVEIYIEGDLGAVLRRRCTRQRAGVTGAATATGRW
jgi:hypothetical protein